jgi:hypothetical protein
LKPNWILLYWEGSIIENLSPAEQCKYCKDQCGSKHYTYLGNKEIRKAVAGNQVATNFVDWLFSQKEQRARTLCYQNLVKFFNENNPQGVSIEEIELVFAVCPLKRTKLQEKLFAEQARLEADKRAEEARLEAERLAEEARLEAEKHAEEAQKAICNSWVLEAEAYALSKIENPTDDWEWWVSDECVALEKKYQEEYILIKQGIIQIPKQEVPLQEQPKPPMSEKAKRRAANKAAAAQREAERIERLAAQSAQISAKKSEKMKSYIPSGW